MRVIMTSPVCQSAIGFMEPPDQRPLPTDLVMGDEPGSADDAARVVAVTLAVARSRAVPSQTRVKSVGKLGSTKVLVGPVGTSENAGCSNSGAFADATMTDGARDRTLPRMTGTIAVKAA